MNTASTIGTPEALMQFRDGLLERVVVLASGAFLPGSPSIKATARYAQKITKFAYISMLAALLNQLVELYFFRWKNRSAFLEGRSRRYDWPARAQAS
jgi:hypothetical protein